MNKRSLSALIAINAVLLSALAVVSFWSAEAQAQAAAAPGEYEMLAGATRGKQQDVIYIIDRRSNLMVALSFISGTNRWEILGGRNMAQDRPQAGR